MRRMCYMRSHHTRGSKGEKVQFKKRIRNTTKKKEQKETELPLFKENRTINLEQVLKMQGPQKEEDIGHGMGTLGSLPNLKVRTCDSQQQRRRTDLYRDENQIATALRPNRKGAETGIPKGGWDMTGGKKAVTSVNPDTTKTGEIIYVKTPQNCVNRNDKV